MRILFYSHPDSNIFTPDLEFDGHQTFYHRGTIESAEAVVIGLKPDLLFVGGYGNSKALVDQLEVINTLQPGTTILLHVEKPDPDFLIQAMRVGVREIISSTTQDSLVETINRLTSRIHVNKKLSNENAARIVGFMSAKGGDGGTCVAANIASALARDHNKRILVIDLSLPFGDIEMFLSNQKQSHDLADFSDEIDRLDSDLMDSMVEHLTENLDLIPAPISVDRLIHIKADHIDRLIELSSSGYDYVIIDIGAGIDPISIHALGKLSELIVVATMTVPSVKRATQVLRYWEELGLDHSKLSVVVNRHYSKADIKITDIEKAMSRKVSHILPQDNSGVQESLLKGVPLIDLRPKSDFSKSILEWASEWSGMAKGKTLWQRLKIK